MTRSMPSRPSDPDIHPVAAVALILGVCLLLWAVAALVFIGTLVVAGSVGLVTLLAALVALWWGVGR